MLPRPMPDKHFLQCTIPAPWGLMGCVTRIAGSVKQTLVSSGERFHPLVGSDAFGGLHLGPPLELYHAKAADEVQTAPRRPFMVQPRAIRLPVWDTWSASVYAIYGDAIVRIKGDEITVMAGSMTEEGRQDGVGTEAWFTGCCALASDGAGALYVAEYFGMLRKVQLPAVLQCRSRTAAAVPAAAAGCQAVVSTMPFMANVRGLVHLPDPTSGPGSLIYATRTALYRIQLGGDGAFAAAPVLLAGWEVDQLDLADEWVEEPHFLDIHGITVDAEGRIICIGNGLNGDSLPDTSTSTVYGVALDGSITTLVAAVSGFCYNPCILPNGCLAMCDWQGKMLVVLGLGLKPQPLTPVFITTSSESQPGSLPADWGNLLDQPDATSDLTLMAGERVFPVHRLVLSVRSEYFRQCLAEGAFAEGSAVELPLLDADPDALACVLRFIYTGAVDIPMALACLVAELADRLLLPKLTTAACEQVWAGVTPETVVELLLWAERCAVRGGGFPQLLEDLKIWYVEHHEDVKREARESLRQLAVASPDLMFELYDMVTSALVKVRARQQLGFEFPYSWATHALNLRRARSGDPPY